MRAILSTVSTLALVAQTLSAAPAAQPSALPTGSQKADTALAPPKGLKTKLPPGYTIPTIDLAAEKHRQIIVDREPGQYLGHPTTVLLEDNKTMLIVYPKGHGRGAIVYKRSTDAGLTWSERLPTPKSWETSLEVPTLHRVVDAAGKKRLILFSGSVSDPHGRDRGRRQELERVEAHRRLRRRGDDGDGH